NKNKNLYKQGVAMDVELQILKHLARDAHSTVSVIDEYCYEYRTYATGTLRSPFTSTLVL
ncbi:MAG: hypothetical protein AAGG00_19300, partial [Cyanobacteria bacterium P01_H01_bin.150]